VEISGLECDEATHSRSHDAVIGVYDEPGNVIETHEHARELENNINALRTTCSMGFLRSAIHGIRVSQK
jgi:hypothetical protein